MRASKRRQADLVGRLARFVMSDTLGAEFLETLRRVEEALQGLDHALIGGQAVFFSGYPRFTEDVDIGVVVPVREAAARLARAGFRPVQGARFIHPTTKVEVDLVKLPRCTIPYVKRPARVTAGPALELPVLALPALVALKVKVGRLKDEADVVELLKHGAVPDRDEVVRLLRSMGEPAEGYDRLVRRAEEEGRAT
ncbi:MAG: hypothetical protein M9894_08965 [Planctomycetes bacterium]|nr:hypothetical protein [Planctomycetota bacterium]